MSKRGNLHGEYICPKCGYRNCLNWFIDEMKCIVCATDLSKCLNVRDNSPEARGGLRRIEKLAR